MSNSSTKDNSPASIKNYNRPCVLVTGITGFVASAVTLRLLELGYIVHGTVRQSTLARLPKYPNHLTQRLKIFECDLMENSSFDSAVESCKYALLLASPSAENEAEEHVRAVENLLQSCLKAGVSRVVHMSCVSAAYNPRAATVTESEWASMSVEKASAERAALNYYKNCNLNSNDNNVPTIVSLVPAIIWGKSLRSAPCKVKTLLIRMARGEIPGLLDMSIPVVHLRDVINALITAMQSQKAQGRYIVCGSDAFVHMRDITAGLQEKGIEPFKNDFKGRMKQRVFKMSSLVSPRTMNRKGMWKKGIALSNGKIVQELGMEFTSKQKALQDAIDDLVEKGYADETYKFPEDVIESNFL